jgi:hypothetical protein
MILPAGRPGRARPSAGAAVARPAPSRCVFLLAMAPGGYRPSSTFSSMPIASGTSTAAEK